jgi:hypothetical protein
MMRKITNSPTINAIKSERFVFEDDEGADAVASE